MLLIDTDEWHSPDWCLSLDWPSPGVLFGNFHSSWECSRFGSDEAQMTLAFCQESCFRSLGMTDCKRREVFQFSEQLYMSLVKWSEHMRRTLNFDSDFTKSSLWTASSHAIALQSKQQQGWMAVLNKKHERKDEHRGKERHNYDPWNMIYWNSKTYTCIWLDKQTHGIVRMSIQQISFNEPTWDPAGSIQA